MENPSKNADTLRAENQVLRAKLQQLQRRRQQVRVVQQRQEQLEMCLHERLNQKRLEQEQALAEFCSATLHQRRLTRLLELSQQWNVLSDVFAISHRGPFGTINGLRLGSEATSMVSLDNNPGLNQQQQQHHAPLVENLRRPFGGGGSGSNSSDTATTTGTVTPHPTIIRVPWMEINAALGHVALLLSTLATRPNAGIVLRHSILPMGSTSKIGIRRGESISLYNLYSDDSFLFFGKRNFNIALQCLLECVLDAVEAVQSRDRTVAVPHTIEKQRDGLTIGGLSVTYGTNGVEWTRAMKYMLTDLKHLLTFRGIILWDP